MLKRKIEKDLYNWKNEENKPCLLVKGARQVGKTFIINDFAKKNYKSYIYINFELMPEYKSIFDGNLDIKTLKMKLEISFPEIPLIEKDTILFLDEIQNCPNARVALKTFALDKTIDVIASGSLLGLYYKEVSSYPVGYERSIELFPIDFEEFLLALNIKEEIIKQLQTNFINKEKVDEFLLQKVAEYFRLYILVGGMPAVVNKYISNFSMNDVLTVQRGITDNYLNDVAKYAKEINKNKIIGTFKSIPVQLAKKNKKFTFNEILDENQNIGSKQYSDAITWLSDAGIINFCYNLTEPAAPLMMNKRMNCYKIYMRDTGLLTSMLETGSRKSIIDDNLYINEGAITENICAAQIITKYNDLFYFEKKSKLEIDFILNIDGAVAAIEIKSGHNKQAKSLKSIKDNYKTVSRYIMFENEVNVHVDENGIEHYPLFMIMFI